MLPGSSYRYNLRYLFKLIYLYSCHSVATPMYRPLVSMAYSSIQQSSIYRMAITSARNKQWDIFRCNVLLQLNLMVWPWCLCERGSVTGGNDWHHSQLSAIYLTLTSLDGMGTSGSQDWNRWPIFNLAFLWIKCFCSFLHGLSWCSPLFCPRRIRSRSKGQRWMQCRKLGRLIGSSVSSLLLCHTQWLQRKEIGNWSPGKALVVSG